MAWTTFPTETLDLATTSSITDTTDLDAVGRHYFQFRVVEPKIEDAEANTADPTAALRCTAARVAQVDLETPLKPPTDGGSNADLTGFDVDRNRRADIGC